LAVNGAEAIREKEDGNGEGNGEREDQR